MKWYSHKLHKTHLADMKRFKDSNEMRQAYQSWVSTMANRFERTYPRIGILNFQDLMQEGYVAFYKAWGKLNWELIGEAIEEERPALITNYIKINIKNHIKRAIARDRDTIRIPEHYYHVKWNYGGQEKKEYNTDVFLTRTFASFETAIDVEYVDDYLSDEINELLHLVMEKFLKSFEKTIIMQSYGIDEAYDKAKPVKAMAEYHKVSETWVKKTKANALKKLRNEDVKKIIEKKLQILYT